MTSSFHVVFRLFPVFFFLISFPVSHIQRIFVSFISFSFCSHTQTRVTCLHTHELPTHPYIHLPRYLSPHLSTQYSMANPSLPLCIYCTSPIPNAFDDGRGLLVALK
ncbi:hypothetical protein BJ912DRAFT_978263 [Pholiota molesta]|nr:hypothetical protein BJ912DRAFT_978263 [Pholiota molesta]